MIITLFKKIDKTFFIFLLLKLIVMPAHAQFEQGLCNNGTVYVPAYSHVYYGNRQSEFMLTVTLSVRNTDLQNKISITSVDYYDNNGKLIKKYLKSSRSLDPLESFHITIPEKDVTGGFGANFLVKWESRQQINSPLMESVMIGTASSQGVSFVSRGREINP
ncbi:DUF3124 domain-containing protein [Maridesulfovibrio sp.]|uniref:DUF3124 domain-containing protein n=1 Tax=Maridesulfovibrio sp. TaxID=2795000 RepID=UPI0029CA7294|nr:DUF3124 domain-containing protein [Maridesulfovibrio sp.]